MIDPPGNITIIAPRGLGDAVVCLPAAYEYVRMGYQVNLLNAGAVNFAATLPVLEPLGTDRDESGEVFDISRGLSFHSEYRMLSQVSLRLGVYPLAIPGKPWLCKPDHYRDLVADLGVPDGYVLVCHRGSQSNRRMDASQVAALARHWPVVVVGETDDAMPGHNMTGRTTLPELYALTAHARAVVSVDTGPLHLSGAFGTPVLAVIGNTLNPYSFCDDYTPSLWLYNRAGDSYGIRDDDLVWGLTTLLEGLE